MVYVYLILNILYIMFSIKFYKNKINPISIYSVVWTFMTILYELKLVYYYDLTLLTWLIIIVFQIAYNFGCIVGKTMSIYTKRYNIKSHNNINITNVKHKKDLKRMIIILSLLASISTISNLSIAIKKYGINLLKYTNQLYAARLAGDIDSGIPYLGIFVYPALIYAGIYFVKFNYNKIILLPIIISALGELKSGGRLNFITGAFLFLIPIIFSKYDIKNIIVENLKKKSNKAQYIKILFSLSIFIILFIIITRNRSTWITYNAYMSPLMIKLMDISPTIYKNYVYITSPLGVLNEFLKDPTFNFGGHTFLTIYNFLNKFGADIPVKQYQTFYNIPISSNVGTYIRELIEDFTIPLGIMVTIFTGMIFSFNYSKFRKTGSYLNLIWASTFAFVIFFSFFTWHFRSSSMWITLVVGTISGIILDKSYTVKLKRNK